VAETDKLFRDAGAPIKPFEFNEQVAGIFADMIHRSVPGYRTLLSLIGILAEQYARPDTKIYDLGCSLGAMTIAMRPYISDKKCTLVCVDNAPAMIERCRLNIDREPSPTPVEVVCEDLRNIIIDNASFVMLNYTLQFIPIEERRSILEGVYAGMVPGAALVLSEKIIEATAHDRHAMETLHERLKKHNGYNDLEIARKRTALEDVLLPETVPAHMERLHAVGLVDGVVWLKCLNFVSIICFKPE